MVDVHKIAKERIVQALCAALVVKPLQPGLSEGELKRVVLEGGGIAGPAFDEVIGEVLDRCEKDADGRAKVAPLHLTMILAFGDSYYPEDLVPHGSLVRVNAAFDDLDAELGKQGIKTLQMIMSACPGESAVRVELAVGFLLALRHLKREGDGFVRIISFDYGDPPRSRPPHPWSKPIQDLKPLVEKVLALRTGSAVPSTPPLDRFFLFLQKQEWTEFAAWWAMTSAEMRSLGEHHPTAVTVLAGALLEAALVAIAEPAKSAGRWNQGFLNNDSTGWRLTQDLIKQAEAAQTFSPSEAAHARTVAELRNRIHAGRFSTSGRGPFHPPSTNSHEAHIAKLHLDLLLDAILTWPPIAALAQGT